MQFFCAKVEDFVKQQPIEKKDALIILDPPRSGMHPKAAKAVAESGVGKVLYISCNPVTLAADLKLPPRKRLIFSRIRTILKPWCS